MPDASPPPVSCDILVAGAGPTGLLAAIVLAKAGRTVIVAGRAPGPLHGRTVALFEGSLAFLRAHDLEALVTAHSARIAGIRIIDDTGSVFSPQPVTFLGSEIGLHALGRNIPNDDFAARLDAFARTLPGIERREVLVRSYDFSGPHARAVLADGSVIDAALIIAADGRASPARAAAGIGKREWSYPQTALTALLSHRRPHNDVSTEFHTRSGPFTFVPMPGDAVSPNRSSLVWLMEPRDAERRASSPSETLAAEIAERAHHRFGAVRLESALGKFPMKSLHATRLIAPRLALIGEAAHAFPPLAAQGLNLGIRDVADLCNALAHCNINDTRACANALSGYEDARRTDIDLRTRSVDALNRSLLATMLPMDFLRGAGLATVARFGPLRRALLREGTMPGIAQKGTSLSATDASHRA